MIRKHTIILSLLFLLTLAVGSTTAYGIRPTGGDSDFEQDEQDPYYPDIVKIYDERDLDVLESQGVIVLAHRENLVLALIPTASEGDRAPRRGSGSPVLRKDFNRPMLDVATSHYDAIHINKGQDFAQPYTGKGVVVGFCDVGFDPSHPTFIAPDGSMRVKRLVEIRETTNEIKVLDTEAEIRNYTTDSEDNWHGSHVAGILAGNGADTDYCSLAPDAEIVATMSMLSDVGLLYGAEKILEYAKSQGKPAVINMSMGNYTGPHDGTSLFCQYLDMIGREAIVVMSAGNDGASANNLLYTLDEAHPSVGFKINNYMIDNLELYGIIDLWCGDDRPVNLTYNIYDDDTREVLYTIPVEVYPEGGVYTIASSTEYDSDAVIDAEFSKVYDGFISFISEINEENGRPHVMIYSNMKTDEKSQRGGWARHTSAIRITPADPSQGASVELYADGVRCRLRQWPGYPGPTNQRCISDLATGFNVVSVGMYNSRGSYPLHDGSDKTVDYPEGYVNINSSYGTLNDGRTLPLTVAPGAGIVSASNSYCVEAHPEAFNTIAHISKAGDREYYWLEDSGTSMSAPYVASAIASWLEALPTLDVSHLKSAIAMTNGKEYPEPEDPRHAAGWFNPKAGLKYLLASFITLSPEAVVSPGRLYSDGSTLCLWNPMESEYEVWVYGTDGAVAGHFSGCEAERRIDLSAFASGIYVARADIAGESPLVLKFVR